MTPRHGRTYVLTHPGYRAVKVGYTTDRSTRIDDFARERWEPYRTLDVATHKIARQIEQAALFEIRHGRLVPPYLTREVWDIVCEQAGRLQLAPLLTGPPDGRRRNGGTPPLRRPGDAPPASPLARTQARIERTTDKDSR